VPLGGTATVGHTAGVPPPDDAANGSADVPAGSDLRDGPSYELVMLLRAHRNVVAAALAEIGLHVGQEMLLLRLWDEDGRSQADLARDMGVEPPTVAKAVARLERTGMVERRADEADRRVSRVWLTESGRSLQGPVLQRWRSIEERMLAGVSAGDVERLRGAVARMSANLAELPVEAPEC